MTGEQHKELVRAILYLAESTRMIAGGVKYALSHLSADDAADQMERAKSHIEAEMKDLEEIKNGLRGVRNGEEYQEMVECDWCKREILLCAAYIDGDPTRILCGECDEAHEDNAWIDREDDDDRY